MFKYKNINSGLLSVMGWIVMGVFILSVSANGYEKFHGGKSEWPKLDYDSLFAAASPLADSPEGRQVIEKCLAAYGGTDHLKNLKSVRQSWRTKEMMLSDSVDIIRMFAADRRYKIDKMYQSGFESRMMDGDQAWYQTADTVIALNSGRYKAEMFSYLVLSMPLAMETERFDGIRYGRRPEDPLHYIYLDKQDSLMTVIGIDPESFFIKKAEGLVRQEGATFIFINLFDDHKEVDGYLFPHSLTNISMGLTVGESTLKAVKVNLDVTAADFIPKNRIID